MQQALIGVDIGTTNIKAVAFSADGKTIAASSSPTPTHYTDNDCAQYEAHEIWRSICRCLQHMSGKLSDKHEPVAISFSSMAEAAFPFDDQDEVLYPAIAWFDRRVAPQLQWWEEHIGSETTASITGLPPATAAGILRLLWLKDNRPEIYKHIKTWLNMADFGIFKLCGEKVTDYSIASRMMILDLAEKNWSQSLLDKLEVSGSLFGQPVPSGIKVGEVSQTAALETGLPEGLPVCSGGHDHVCASLGLGMTSTGQVFDSMGTAEVIMATFSEPVLDKRITTSGIAQGCHVIPDRYYAMSGLQFSGGSVDWIGQCLSLDHDSLVSLASDVPAGSDGVFFLPHLRQANPPRHDPDSRGAFIGLTSETGAGHMARAVLEGLAYEYQQIFDTTIEAFSLSPTTLVASGGGTRNPLLMEIKAHVSGMPITIPEVDEAACLGAAVLAGIGTGIYEDYADVKEHINYSSRQLEPDATLHKTYREQYEKTYLGMYDSLRT